MYPCVASAQNRKFALTVESTTMTPPDELLAVWRISSCVWGAPVPIPTFPPTSETAELSVVPAPSVNLTSAFADADSAVTVPPSVDTPPEPGVLSTDLTLFARFEASTKSLAVLPSSDSATRAFNA